MKSFLHALARWEPPPHASPVRDATQDDPVARFLKEHAADRFFCPFLGGDGATISLEECRDRQLRPEPKHSAAGKEYSFKLRRSFDDFCRSGECKLGRDNRRQLVQLKRKK